MTFFVSLFSPENSRVSATGTWQVTADSAAQALGMTRFYADSRYWPPGSTWLCVPLDDDPRQWDAGFWDPA